MSFETLVSYRKITRHHDTEDLDLNFHRRENLKSSNSLLRFHMYNKNSSRINK